MSDGKNSRVRTGDVGFDRLIDCAFKGGAIVTVEEGSDVPQWLVKSRIRREELARRNQEAMDRARQTPAVSTLTVGLRLRNRDPGEGSGSGFLSLGRKHGPVRYRGRTSRTLLPGVDYEGEVRSGPVDSGPHLSGDGRGGLNSHGFGRLSL